MRHVLFGYGCRSQNGLSESALACGDGRATWETNTMYRKALLLRILAAGLVGWCGTVADAGLVAHWSFDETSGTEVAESSGLVNLNGVARTATASGGVDLSAAGVFNTGVSLDGVEGSYLTIPYLDGVHRNSFTIAAWVNPSDTGINTILSDWIRVWGFRFFLTTQVVMNHRYASGANTYSVSGGTVQTGQWQHVAITWDRPSKTATLYLNGAPVASVVSTQSGANLDMENTNRNYHIGWKQDSTDTFNGSLDELWVFNQALSEKQIRELRAGNSVTLYEGRMGINFRGGGGSGTPAVMGTSEVAGHPNVAQSYWNTAQGASGTLTGLSKHDGKNSGAEVHWIAGDGTYSTAVTDAPGNNRMMKGYIDNFDNDGTNTFVTVSNVPAAWLEYDLYVYFDGNNGTTWRKAAFEVTDSDGVSRSDDGEDSESCDFHKAKVNYQFQHPWPGGTSNQDFVYGPNNDEGNYVRLSGFTGRHFTLEAWPSGGNSLRAPVNGIQIVATTREPPLLGSILIVR